MIGILERISDIELSEIRTLKMFFKNKDCIYLNIYWKSYKLLWALHFEQIPFAL